jgi:hypothetical protein
MEDSSGRRDQEPPWWLGRQHHLPQNNYVFVVRGRKREMTRYFGFDDVSLVGTQNSVMASRDRVMAQQLSASLLQDKTR